jgi:hypothetical protein
MGSIEEYAALVQVLTKILDTGLLAQLKCSVAELPAKLADMACEVEPKLDNKYVHGNDVVSKIDDKHRESKVKHSKKSTAVIINALYDALMSVESEHTDEMFDKYTAAMDDGSLVEIHIPDERAYEFVSEEASAEREECARRLDEEFVKEPHVVYVPPENCEDIKLLRRELLPLFYKDTKLFGAERDCSVGRDLHEFPDRTDGEWKQGEWQAGHGHDGKPNSDFYMACQELVNDPAKFSLLREVPVYKQVREAARKYLDRIKVVKNPVGRPRNTVVDVAPNNLE